MAISVTQNSHRYKAVITITAGTPIFVAGGLTPILADRIVIQMLSGGTGKGLVYDDVPVGMLAAAVAAGGDVAMELAPATSTSPGGSYADTGTVDLRQIAIDGSHTGDVALVNAHLKI